MLDVPYQVEILGKKDIPSAEKLLYQVYVEEMGWKIKDDNASNLKKIEEKSGNRLTDDFADSAHWFGIFYNKSLIGVHRIVEPIEGKLETERYIELPKHIKDENPYEFNRLAIQKNHRASPAVILLFYKEYQYLNSKKKNLAISTTEFPDPGNFYLKIGARKAEFKQFKYDEEDQNFVELICYDFVEEPKKTILGKLSKRITKKYSKNKSMKCEVY